MQLPSSLGRYHLDEVIGAGTFATVFHGRDEALDVPVAVKVLGENWSFDPEVRSRFIAEAQLLRRAGQRVVRVHDIGQTEDARPYFVMDFAENGTVEDRLAALAAEGARLQVEDLSRLARQLAAGVREVHALGVVHRDLKPSNLLLRRIPAGRAGTGGPHGPPDGPGDAPAERGVGTALVHADEHVVIGDLGLARDLDGPTRLTAAVGTPGYMAPEQQAPGTRVDTRADIYAATAILHTVVTGAPPPLGTAAAAAHEDLPDPVRALLVHGLAEDPEDRFGSIDEWLDAVESALDVVGGDWRSPEPTIGFVSELSTLTRSTPPPRVPRPAPTVRPTGAPATALPPAPGPAPAPRRSALLVVATLGALIVVGAAVAATLFSRNAPSPEPASGTSGTVPGVAPRPASETRLIDPIDVATGPDGSVFVVELSAHRVQRLGRDGTMSVVAGTGVPGFSGDGGPATSARLSFPTGVGVAPDGSVLVADNGNGRVRRIAGDGTITTVAGTGQSGPGLAGQVATASPLSPTDVTTTPDGTVIVNESSAHRVWSIADGKLNPFAGTGDKGNSGDGGDARDAKLMSPSTVLGAADGSVYVTDTKAGVVRRVSPDGTIGTVAGSGTSGFSGDGGPGTLAELDGPDGVAVDGAGNLYIADTANERIRRLSTDGTISTAAGSATSGFAGDGGPATAAEFAGPIAVAYGLDGAAVVVDSYNNRLRAIAADGTISTVAGTGPSGRAGDGGPAVEAPVYEPEGIAFDREGNLLVAENYSGRIRKVDSAGVISTVAAASSNGPGDGGPARTAEIDSPAGIATDAYGNVYLAETVTSLVRGITAGGTILRLAGTGVSGFSGDGGPGLQAQLNTPVGLAIDAGGLLLADGANGRVRRLSWDGTITTVAGTGPPTGDEGRDLPALQATLALPWGIAVAPDGSILVTETVGERVRRVDPVTSAMTVIAGTGQSGFSGDGGTATAARLSGPAGVAVAGDGTVFISEGHGNRIRRIAPDGVITTVAGTGEAGFSGDGGPAQRAQLSSPEFLAIGPDGALYVSDKGNNRVRRIDLSNGTITTVAGAF